jgi:WD40 repeat protein
VKQVVPGPYKGLVPYIEDDYPYFFGRGVLRRTIAANLKSAPLTALYGPSGVGKSSLLSAGVVHDLMDASRQNLTERGRIGHLVVPFRSWQGDFRAGLANELLERARAFDAEVDAGGAFEGLCKAWIGKEYGRLLLILDQFEEFFLYHTDAKEQTEFGLSLADLIEQGARVLVSLREDQLSLLERLRPALPAIFSNQIRVDHLDEKGAREAIEKPPEEWNRRKGTKWTVDPALVDEVIAQLSPASMKRQAAAAGIGTGGVVTSTLIQAPWLQIVMSRLWTEEAATQAFRVETLRRLKGVVAIAEQHLDYEMRGLTFRERLAASGFFQKLVTPSGTKVLYPKKDLIEGAGWLKGPAESALNKLSGTGRIVEPIESGEPRYQIYHDQLGPAILAWRQRFRARIWFVAVPVVAFLFLVMAAAVLVPRYFSVQNEKREITTGAAALASLQRTDLSEDVRRVLAIYALAGTSGIPIVQEKAQQAFISEFPFARFGFNKLYGVAFSPNASYIALSGVGDAVWLMHRDNTKKIDTSYDVRLLDATTGPVISVAMESQYLATGSMDGIVRLYDPGSGSLKRELTGHVGQVNRVAINSNETMVASAGKDGTVRVWETYSGRPLATLQMGGAAANAVEFDRKDPYLSAGDADGNLFIWKIPAWGTPAYKEHLPGIIVVLRSSRDGGIFAIGGMSGQAGWVRKTVVGAPSPSLPSVSFPSAVFGLGFLTRGLIVGLRNGEMLAGNLENGTGAPGVFASNAKGPINWLDASSGGTLAATVDDNANFRIWDERLRELVIMPTGGLRPFSIENNNTLRMSGSKGMVVDWNWTARTAHIDLQSDVLGDGDLTKSRRVRVNNGIVLLLPENLDHAKDIAKRLTYVDLTPAQCREYLGQSVCPQMPQIK